MSTRARSKLNTSPMAVTSGGNVLVNVAQAYGVTNVAAAVKRALDEGGAIFIGVVVTSPEARRVLHQFDDATAEIAAFILGGRHRRRKTRRRST